MSTQRLLFLAPAQAVTRIFPQLRDAGFEVALAENLNGATVFVRKSGPGLIFARPSLPGFQVEDLLAVSADDADFPPVIVISERGTADEARRLMGLGARDYWLEPLSFESLPLRASLALLFPFPRAVRWEGIARSRVRPEAAEMRRVS